MCTGTYLSIQTGWIDCLACRRGLPSEGRTELDILAEMGRGTSLTIYLTTTTGDQRSMDLDLLRTVASQVRVPVPSSTYRLLPET